MKKLIGIRISALTETQLAELTSKLGMTQTEVISHAVETYYQKMEDKMTKTVTSFLRERPDKIWRYVGTIWGNEEYTSTGREIANQIEDIQYGGDMVEHPTTGTDEAGYYLQSGNVHYFGRLIDEVVLEAI